MNDYFDHVERSLRDGARERLYMPWYARLLSRRSRPALLGVVVLLGGGTALAATGVLRIGASVSSEVRPLANAAEGAVIPSSVRVLPIRVPDPDGGPPWGLRAARTSRGLLCVQVGRIVGGRAGVLGRDGAFHDDGAFHPFASSYLSGIGCATEDARGDAFINYQLHAIPASGLLDNRRDATGGCYGPHSAAAECPPSQLRDVYFGMLGPDATSVTARTAGRGTTTVSTAAPSGAYLVVLPHSSERRCEPGALVCSGGGGGGRGYTFSPTLSTNPVITGVTYRNAPPCRLHETEEAPRRTSCPAVGFVAPRARGGAPTVAELTSPVTVQVERATRYCERREAIVACDGRIPRGYTPLPTIGPPEVLLIVDFTARRAVTNFDSHYEIETSIPRDRRHPGFQEGCGGTFGPTQTNLRAGQHIRYATFMNARCHGTTRVTVSYVTVNGPSGATPVPGLPGQSAPIPVGHATVQLP